MNILSISLVVFVVASACGFEQFVRTRVRTTPKPTACGGALSLLAPYLTKHIPHRRLHYNYYVRHSVPYGSKDTLTSMDFASAASSLLKDFVRFASGRIDGLQAPYLNNEPRYSPIRSRPRYQAPSTFEGTSGFLVPYFANRFSNLLPRDQAPSRSEGTGGLRTHYFANEPRYSPILPPPMDRVSSAPRGPLGSPTHYLDEILRNALLNLLLRNKLPSASGGPHGYQILYIPGSAPRGQSPTMHRGWNKPPRHHQPKATHRKFGPDDLPELLRQIMIHKSTNSRTASKPFTLNGSEAIRHPRRPRIHVFAPRRRIPKRDKHKARHSQTSPAQRLSQRQPTRVSLEDLFPRTIFTPLTVNS